MIKSVIKNTCKDSDFDTNLLLSQVNSTQSPCHCSIISTQLVSLMLNPHDNSTQSPVIAP